MGNLSDYAEAELRRAGYFDKGSDYDGLLGPAVMKMVKIFEDENHSGMSAPYAISLFKRVAMFRPLLPLTGADDEWMEIGTNQYQNKRCSCVFKDAKGAYDIEGRVFHKKGGGSFTAIGSHVPVTFPYYPTQKVVEVDEDDKPIDPHESGPRVDLRAGL